MSDNKRQFHRVAVPIAALLVNKTGRIDATLSDVSLRGFGLVLEQDSALNLDDQYTLTLQLENEAPAVTASVIITHYSPHTSECPARVGCGISQIDIESAASLRQLLLLNTDEQQQQQDLNALLDAMLQSASNASLS